MAKKVESKKVNLNPDELKAHLRHVIDNNRYLQKERKQKPIAVGIAGNSGLGKTSIVEQVAVEKDLNYVKVNLAQIGEEVSELVGYPIRQFEMKPVNGEGKNIWADEQVAESYKNKGYDFTGKNQTGYCPPEWIANVDPSKGGIFNLDDFTRGSMRTLQAVMEIVDRQTYISWKLPPGWTVVLTENPADGDYLVNEIDDAQRSRYTGVNLTFNIECWMRFAEENGVDGRCINFLGLNPELVNKDCNPRSITTFFNSISSIKRFEDELPLIQILGEGSVGIEFSSMFTSFINNKLDLLISPKIMLEDKDWKKVKALMVDNIGKGDKYRADIAAVLTTRIINHSQLIAKEDSVTQTMIDRIIALATDDVIADDLKFLIPKALLNGEGKAKFEKLLLNKDMNKMVLK